MPGNTWKARAYGKCHRKYTAGATVTVRVKRCGKSAPRVWQQTWQGKPHPEQDQIGERSCGPHGSRVGCLRCTVTYIPEEWLSTTEPGLPAGSLLILYGHGSTRNNTERIVIISRHPTRGWIKESLNACHSRASGNPGSSGSVGYWIPAFAGMTYSDDP